MVQQTKLSSLLQKGRPLKMVIMSATLRVEDFRDNKLLFPDPPPVLKVCSPDSGQPALAGLFNSTCPQHSHDAILDCNSQNSSVHSIQIHTNTMVCLN